MIIQVLFQIIQVIVLLSAMTWIKIWNKKNWKSFSWCPSSVLCFGRNVYWKCLQLPVVQCFSFAAGSHGGLHWANSRHAGCVFPHDRFLFFFFGGGGVWVAWLRKIHLAKGQKCLHCRGRCLNSKEDIPTRLMWFTSVYFRSFWEPSQEKNKSSIPYLEVLIQTKTRHCFSVTYWWTMLWQIGHICYYWSLFHIII